MQLKNLNICVCSENDNINPLKSILKGIGNQNYLLTNIKFEELAAEQQDIVIYYLNKLTPPFLQSLEKLKSNPRVKPIIVLESSDIQLVSTLAKMGFSDLFVFPYELYKFHSYIEDLLQSYRPENTAVENDLEKDNKTSSFIGTFSGIENIKAMAKKASQNPALNVLLLGDTGTGKSVLAKLIHSLGEKRSAPFVEVICTAIPENLLESELFGYEKGAFTDAKNRKVGLFELAEGGTIFLDEIGDLSMNLQAKLLRVTENKVIRRLGGIKDIPINTRIITATNRNLEKRIAENLFRSDLYFRLNMITITLPPLIERNNDILTLAENFVREFSDLYGKKITSLSDCAWQAIRSYSWPGNIRELRNIIERAVLLSEGTVLDEQDFINLKKGSELLQQSRSNNSIEQTAQDGQKRVLLQGVYDDGSIVLRLNSMETTLLEINKVYAKIILEKFKGNKSKASKILGISRPTLDNLLN